MPNSALLKSLGSWLYIRLSAAMKLLCVYLNTCLMKLLEINSILVIWYERTGCAQYCNSYIAIKESKWRATICRALTLRELTFTVFFCWVLSHDKPKQTCSESSLQITLAGPEEIVFSDGSFGCSSQKGIVAFVATIWQLYSSNFERGWKQPLKIFLCMQIFKIF